MVRITLFFSELKPELGKNDSVVADFLSGKPVVAHYHS